MDGGFFKQLASLTCQTPNLYIVENIDQMAKY